ncbi:MAG: hypothetical protein IPK94_22830 [Saprospiraceae bacterium]|nr:hypothetical protein [Saprospiraceae bacterium]
MAIWMRSINILLVVYVQTLYFQNQLYTDQETNMMEETPAETLGKKQYLEWNAYAANRNKTNTDFYDMIHQSG